mmetsp:Transcript_74941/g.243519  ORF Transcript_74941/g.243519 Transcript_74941/m.243519 type:complete len:206 (-) Transcript_74941:1650-2267(-)
MLELPERKLQAGLSRFGCRSARGRPRTSAAPLPRRRRQRRCRRRRRPAPGPARGSTSLQSAEASQSRSAEEGPQRQQRQQHSRPRASDCVVWVRDPRVAARPAPGSRRGCLPAARISTTLTFLRRACRRGTRVRVCGWKLRMRSTCRNRLVPWIASTSTASPPSSPSAPPPPRPSAPPAAAPTWHWTPPPCTFACRTSRRGGRAC